MGIHINARELALFSDHYDAEETSRLLEGIISEANKLKLSLQAHGEGFQEVTFFTGKIESAVN
jgi:hypothetical protein